MATVGNGTTTAVVRRTVDVSGLASGVRTIAAGGHHTYALTRRGGVRCWGSNLSGGVGSGLRVIVKTPFAVPSLRSGVKAITAGPGFNDATCVITRGGAAKCWGQNSQGWLGVGSKEGAVLKPTGVVGLTRGVSAISHTCGLTSAGGVECWGDNEFGQLGNGSTADSSTPVDVVGLESGVLAVSAGIQHTCAITRGGAAMCGGSNQFGQLGTGSAKGSTKHVPVRP